MNVENILKNLTNITNCNLFDHSNLRYIFFKEFEFMPEATWITNNFERNYQGVPNYNSNINQELPWNS